MVSLGEMLSKGLLLGARQTPRVKPKTPGPLLPYTVLQSLDSKRGCRVPALCLPQFPGTQLTFTLHGEFSEGRAVWQPPRRGWICTEQAKASGPGGQAEDEDMEGSEQGRVGSRVVLRRAAAWGRGGDPNRPGLGQ